MFIRKNKNRSGSVSIQIMMKRGRTNKVVKTIGIAHTERELQLLTVIASNEMEKVQGLQSLFIEEEDLIVDSFVSGLGNNQLQTVGPQLVLGSIYDSMGYPQGSDWSYFKHLVLSRLVYPGSKLKTVEYLKRHLCIDLSVYTVYRYLDGLDAGKRELAQQATFKHSLKVLKGRIGIVFYDMTTLYFEASDEDDLRKAGYNKDGKHQNPQIMLGMLVGRGGYPMGYELFEGNKSEVKTLIPVLEAFQEKFKVKKPIVVADCAMLSEKNIEALKDKGYKYIIGGKVKNESQELKEQVLSLNIKPASPKEIKNRHGRLIVSYSDKRAKKDEHNRQKGLKRLEEKVKSGKLKKDSINNRGYNKYLVLEGEMRVSIDYQKFKSDKVWDGLKGYSTNTTIKRKKVIEEYSNLYLIEKAFRISKTDLRIRPIYHRISERIEAHVAICFAAYAVYKELERRLKESGLQISPEKAINIIKEMQQLTYQLPKSKEVKTKILNLTKDQEKLLNIAKL